MCKIEENEDFDKKDVSFRKVKMQFSYVDGTKAKYPFMEGIHTIAEFPRYV